jgi:hypothetical protein
MSEYQYYKFQALDRPLTAEVSEGEAPWEESHGAICAIEATSVSANDLPHGTLGIPEIGSRGEHDS